nr:immunoglobulin heavy chain junction region [Mus musculus]MBK4195113.1 immunoglobulin heavy chain junction region [Mus musculus]MBK4195114.1 immunoglobulin heavy chain junction region [Mus musculus]MBK4195115.1 immunoglobulin heavy chain junction region [Mus musculus]
CARSLIYYYGSSPLFDYW